jgi:hypothetical protein
MANNEATTQGVVAVAGNLAEGFEGTVEGWVADPEWYLSNLTWLPPYEGALAIYSHAAENFTGSKLVSPKVVLTGAEELNFYASFGNQSTGAADLAVDYSADGVIWTNILPAFVPTETMQLYTVDLSAIPAGEYHLAFVTSGSTDGTYRTIISIDHIIGPELVPMGVDIPANLAIAMVGAVPQLSWEAVTNANSYNVYASANPYGTFTLLGSTDAVTYDLTGVEGYQFYHVTASTDPMVTYASRNTVVSKKPAHQSVSLIPQGSAQEQVVTPTIDSRSLLVPKGLRR